MRNGQQPSCFKTQQNLYGLSTGDYVKDAQLHYRLLKVRTYVVLPNVQVHSELSLFQLKC